MGLKLLGRFVRERRGHTKRGLVLWFGYIVRKFIPSRSITSRIFLLFFSLTLRFVVFDGYIIWTTTVSYFLVAGLSLSLTLSPSLSLCAPSPLCKRVFLCARGVFRIECSVSREIKLHELFVLAIRTVHSCGLRIHACEYRSSSRSFHLARVESQREDRVRIYTGSRS